MRLAHTLPPVLWSCISFLPRLTTALPAPKEYVTLTIPGSVTDFNTSYTIVSVSGVTDASKPKTVYYIEAHNEILDYSPLESKSTIIHETFHATLIAGSEAFVYDFVEGDISGEVMCLASAPTALFGARCSGQALVDGEARIAITPSGRLHTLELPAPSSSSSSTPNPANSSDEPPNPTKPSPPSLNPKLLAIIILLPILFGLSIALCWFCRRRRIRKAELREQKPMPFISDNSYSNVHRTPSSSSSTFHLPSQTSTVTSPPSPSLTSTSPTLKTHLSKRSMNSRQDYPESPFVDPESDATIDVFDSISHIETAAGSGDTDEDHQPQMGQVMDMKNMMEELSRVRAELAELKAGRSEGDSMDRRLSISTTDTAPPQYRV